MTESLQGKTAVVTGDTSGIGWASVLDFAKHGVNVVASGRREERGAEPVAEAQGLPGKVIFVRADVTVETDIENQMATAVSEFGSLDFAFNNAGGEVDGGDSKWGGVSMRFPMILGTITLTRSSRASGGA
jgi:NAD(P)-dependent dehydrogenase (short-subunit alcohol dehydrogenase family)